MNFRGMERFFKRGYKVLNKRKIWYIGFYINLKLLIVKRKWKGKFR